MALSLATQHRKRVERLVKEVKEYARAAGVNETTASRRVLNASHELERLEKGGLLSPKTLEKRERDLRQLRKQLRPDRQALSA